MLDKATENAAGSRAGSQKRRTLQGFTFSTQVPAFSGNRDCEREAKSL
jgi:hypothetical protein